MAQIMDLITEDELKELPVNLKNKVVQTIAVKDNELVVQKLLLQNKEKEIETLRIETECNISELKQLLEDKTKVAAALDVEKLKIKSDLSKLEEEVKQLQSENIENISKMSELQKEIKQITHEREQLSYMVDRRNEQIERFQKDIQEMDKVIESFNNAKHRLSLEERHHDDSKAQSSFREQISQQEIQFLRSQLSSLKGDLERNINELSSNKREYSLKMIAIENKLVEKTEDLKIAKSTICHLEKNCSSLTASLEELSLKSKSEADDLKQLIDFYEKELQSQKRLVNLYKENSNESHKQVEKLASTVSELQALLFEATSEQSVLESSIKSKDVQHESELLKQDLTIKNLQDEITTFSHFFKVSPTAENVSLYDVKIPSNPDERTRLSLPQLYRAYAQVTEQLLQEKKQNEKLKLQLRQVLSEIEERSPILKQQSMEYQTLIDANNKLAEQLENMLEDKLCLSKKCDSISAKLAFVERENSKLSKERVDLGKQICHLLKEVENLRGGGSYETSTSIGFDMSADEVISKRLVTFSNIEELQANNTKLLLLVRDLSSKLEEIEESQASIDVSKFEEKVQTYSKRIEELQNMQEKQAETMKECFEQRDKYKELYLKCVRDTKSDYELDIEGIVTENKELQSKLKTVQNAVENSEKNIADLQESVQKSSKEIDKLQNEVKDLTTKNYKLAATVEFKTEQLRLEKKTQEHHKKQIDALEQRTRNYESIITKHEVTIGSLSEELFKLQNKHIADESKVLQLEKENEILRESEQRLLLEKQMFERENQGQQLLLTNLEFIKKNLVKSETEGRARLEKCFEETTRECFALRRSLQEKTDEYTVNLNNLKRSLEEASQSSASKDAEIKRLHNETILLTNVLQEKTGENAELQRKLQLTEGNVKSDSTVKELKMKLEQNAIEIETLKKEVSLIRDHSKQYCQMAEAIEADLESKTAGYKAEKEKLSNKIAELQQENSAKTNKLQEIERQLISNSFKSVSNESEAIAKLKDDIKDVLEKQQHAEKELKQLRDRNSELSNEIQRAEQKYANEMILHSADVQALATLKEKLQTVTEELSVLRASKESTREEIKKQEMSFAELEESLKHERDQFKLHIENLEKHNKLLHQQVEELSSNVLLISRQESMAESDDIDSFETRNNGELQKIIKYLRQEKEIVTSKFDSCYAKNERLSLEIEVLRKNNKTLQEKLNSERNESEIMIASTSKHQEMLRKLEMVNAMTDSNRILREERDNANKRLADIAERLQQLEVKFLPLQEKNVEFQSKIDLLSGENSSLRIEVTRWRQRATNLTEKASKVNVEDIKRLTAEKENLMKLIANEKETNKHLADELTNQKAERIKVENELSTLRTLKQKLEAENAKEIQALKDACSKLQSDIKDIVLKLSEKEKEIAKLREENDQKEAQLNDIKSKESQIRKIAKRYKDSYLELKKNMDEKSIDPSIQVSQTENAEFGEQLINLNEENSSLKKEIEHLRACLEKEERNRGLLRDAKLRIMALQAANKELHSKKAEAIFEATDSEAIGGPDFEMTKHFQSSSTSQTIKEGDSFVSKAPQLNRQVALQSVKPMPASTSTDKLTEVRTANVKPITPSVSQNPSSITTWRGSDTPLASIRPMTVQNGRNANITLVSEVTPSSLNIEQSIANTSSPNNSVVVVATVPPLASSEDVCSQLDTSDIVQDESSNSTGSGNITHQSVALISPRVEQSQSHELTSNLTVSNDNEPKPSSSSSSILPSTTTHILGKRSREIEVIPTADPALEISQTKKIRVSDASETQSVVTKFANEIEYQVPTSSQHDNDEDIVDLESDREVSIESSEKPPEGILTPSDKQKKEEVTSAQNAAEESDGNATSSDNANRNYFSPDWYQHETASPMSATPLHTTVDETLFSPGGDRIIPSLESSEPKPTSNVEPKLED